MGETEHQHELEYFYGIEYNTGPWTRLIIGMSLSTFIGMSTILVSGGDFCSTIFLGIYH